MSPGLPGSTHRVKPSILLLAQRCGCPIIPVGCYISWKLSVDSGWERFVIPSPLPRVRCVLVNPVPLTADTTRQQREAAAREIAEPLDSLSRQFG